VAGPALTLAACATPTPEAGTAPQAPMGVADPMRVNDCDSLVPIEAEDVSQGYARELAWLEASFPGAVIVNQSLTDCAGTPADRIVFTVDGETRVVLFDASSFFGKVGGEDLNELLEG
jgi:hypothetical protein